MRHRKKGRRLGRSSSHRRALFRNMASALFLTEREFATDEKGAPKVPGRIITTLPKAKEIRPYVERCVTIARKGLEAEAKAKEFGTDAERNSQEWKTWRESETYTRWNNAMAPAVTARRRCYDMLQDKTAVSILFSTIAPRFMDRPGGYTRIMRLATPRLGDNGTRAILEFVGKNDRVQAKSEKPEFGSAPATEEAAAT